MKDICPVPQTVKSISIKQSGKISVDSTENQILS